MNCFFLKLFVTEWASKNIAMFPFKRYTKIVFEISYRNFKKMSSLVLVFCQCPEKCQFFLRTISTSFGNLPLKPEKIRRDLGVALSFLLFQSAFLTVINRMTAQGIAPMTAHGIDRMIAMCSGLCLFCPHLDKERVN